MASWVFHLRIAESVLGTLGDLQQDYFAIGNIAPDSGAPDKSWKSYSPPVEVSHFYSRGRTVFPVEDAHFYQQYLANGLSGGMDQERRSFLLGYLCHLLTDCAWSNDIYRPLKAQYQQELERNPDFLDPVRQDCDAFDYAFLVSRPEWPFWKSFKAASYARDLIDRMPLELVQTRHAYIVGYYEEAILDIENGKGISPFRFLTGSRIAAFLEGWATEVAGIMLSLPRLAAMAKERGTPSLLECARTLSRPVTD